MNLKEILGSQSEEEYNEMIEGIAKDYVENIIAYNKWRARNKEKHNKPKEIDNWFREKVSPLQDANDFVCLVQGDTWHLGENIKENERMAAKEIGYNDNLLERATIITEGIREYTFEGLTYIIKEDETMPNWDSFTRLREDK